MKQLLIVFCGLVLSFTTLFASANTSSWFDYYKIEDVPLPNTVDPQIGGLAALKDGRVALTVHSGEVIIYNPINNKWTTFATGLHEPLGIVQDNNNSFVVTQAAELTRLIDENKDGQADFYQTISDDFGMTGNYHEFTFGPAVDKDGNYYISLNVASNFAGIFEHIRGEYSPLCPPQEKMRQWHDKTKWREGYRKKVTRMFSCAPYRGWILKISPDGKTEPFASGFRSPNGLAFDNNNKLWAIDNQGDWIATSPLLQVNKGDFMGHPVSLVWQSDWNTRPENVTSEQLSKLRKPAAALFPQGELANSPTQPVNTISPELFGLPEGELLIGDMNQNNLIRYLPDEINGVSQGTLIPFIAGDELGIGNNRLGFSPDGSLWVGKTHLGWAGDQGLRKINWTGKKPLLVEKVQQTTEGFNILFNKPLEKAPKSITVTSHGYLYHAKYGSEKTDVKTLTPTKLALKHANKTLSISLPKLEKDRLYTIELTDTVDKKSQPLMGNVLRYNLVELSK